MTAEIRDVSIERDDDGAIKRVTIVFGPHYFIELFAEGGKVTCHIGATHHGIKADASVVGGELEQFVYELRDSHPGNAFD